MTKEKSKEPSFYYQIYGDITNYPVGVISSELPPTEAEALELAKKPLAERGIIAKKAVKVENKEGVTYKRGGSTIDFLNDADFDLDLTLVGKIPCLIFYLGLTEGKKTKGRGIGFCDKESFNSVFEKMLRIKHQMDKMK